MGKCDRSLVIAVSRGVSKALKMFCVKCEGILFCFFVSGYTFCDIPIQQGLRYRKEDVRLTDMNWLAVIATMSPIMR